MKKYGESYLQQNCVKWFKLAYPHELILSIPNEGIRSAKTASRMKAEGLMSGVADLQVIRAGEMPLFIEMKYGNNTQSPSQKEFEKRVKTIGCRYVICKTIDNFIDEVNKYFENKKT